MKDILLSVICPTYGHEQYIRQALDSILMQKFDFPMEVLIGEDCSPDNSRVILKEYERKYPGFFTVFYREHNLGGAKNSADLRNRAKGKYLAFLELDDYWTDYRKLQKQVNYLETHDDVVAVSGKTKVVDKNGQPMNMEYKYECLREYYTWDEYFNFRLPGQTASIVCRNIFKDDGLAFEVSNDYSLIPGDRKFPFLYLCYGKVYCFQETMSAYRYVYDGGYSYSANYRYSEIEFYIDRVALYRGLLDYAYKYCSKKNIINAEIMYSLFNYGLYRAKSADGDRKSLSHYLAFDLDVKHKNFVRMYFLREKFHQLTKLRNE